MLQRAASNAYSWWWASHIRTKQGKWLEQSLQDMEDRVKHILQIIEEDADSFARRAEMYYKKRPELINFVEESYRAYRALAERYEKISGELQNANHTIASVCPEQVEFAMEDDGDDDQDQPPRPPSSDDDQENPPKPPLPDPSKIPKPLPEHLKFNFKGNALRKHPKHALPPKSKKPQSTTSSQKNSKEAQERIDKLQKDILVLQTEKEFVTSSYESAMEKCWEIEKQITEMQEEICSLQDEFSVETVIEDNEARALMTAMALKSCKDTLVQLRDKQKKFVGEAKVESKRVRDAEEMLKALKEGRSTRDQTEKTRLSDSSIENFDEECSSLNQEGLVLQSICEKIKEYFEANSNTARIVTELAESVDELVTKVLGLETALSSQTALVERLRLEADELHNHLKSLEEAKAASTKNSKDRSGKIKELEGELHRVKGLNQSVEARNVELRMSLMEACHNFGDLFNKIQSLKQKDEVEPMDASGANEGALLEEGFLLGEGLHKEEMEEEEELPDLQQLLSDGLEDKEKVILKEYTSILRNYKETKKRLSEMEKKNKETVAMKDAEIESLKHKLGDHQGGSDGESDTLLKEPKDSTENESKSSENDAKITGHKQQKALEELLYERHSDYYAPKLDESSISILEEDIKVAAEEEHALSTVEEKFRKDLDELVEENLQFWLKFTSSYHQIQIFQKILKELQSEVQRLRKDSKKHDSNANASNTLDTNAEAISKRLKELRIELFRWLEQNVQLKEELRRRLSLLCNMQEEISRVSKTSSESEQAEISPLQAAKFLGEIRNMQQGNNKVADELQAGLNHVRRLQMDAEKLSKRRGIIEVSGAKSHRYHHVRYSTSRSKIPLRSFIFGVKTKKSASVSSTMPQNANASLHQQRSSG